MSQHICDRCHKDLHYKSTLERHTNKTKPCTPINNNLYNNQPNTNINTKTAHESNKCMNDSNLFQIFQSNINNANTLQDTKQIFNEFITFFNNKLNTPTPIITPTTPTTPSALTIIPPKHVCSKCTSNFSSRQGLHKHIKNNKCKTTPLSQVTTGNSAPNIVITDINNSDLLINANNITNNNTTNNNTTNNITININPFKCESLSHITLANFKTIYKSIYNIDALLCYFIYKRNQNNISFFKNNINKNIVSVLNNKMEIEKMTDEQFIRL